MTVYVTVNKNLVDQLCIHKKKNHNYQLVKCIWKRH